MARSPDGVRREAGAWRNWLLRSIAGQPGTLQILYSIDGARRLPESAWSAPDNGLWEVRGDRQHFTHSKVMAWVAADRKARSVRGELSEGGLIKRYQTTETDDGVKGGEGLLIACSFWLVDALGAAGQRLVLDRNH